MKEAESRSKTEVSPPEKKKWYKTWWGVLGLLIFFGVAARIAREEPQKPVQTQPTTVVTERASPETLASLLNSNLTPEATDGFVRSWESASPDFYVDIDSELLSRSNREIRERLAAIALTVRTIYESNGYRPPSTLVVRLSKSKLKYTEILLDR